MKRPTPASMILGFCMAAMASLLGYQQYQLVQLRSGVNSAAEKTSIEAILARLNRLDAVDGQHLVSNEDFRSGQQVLSNRIDAAQAFAKQASDAVENLAQTTASAGDLLVLKATVETLDGSVRTLQEKQAKAPPLIVPPPKRGAFPVKPKPKPKPIEPPPFSILGVEYRGGERFLSVPPPGSTQLSQIYLIRQGDAVAGTTWRLTDLDDRTAHFDVAGASRSVRIQP
ncbi:methyl-accepting chemotaxis protein [Pseudomonas aeruginosa]|uniref:methyl-accepting chemotaxis protein n=1 Tax=Pseudomonas aeruginosa TaxID=287 RepID=UPI000F5C15AE|nr:methyl-accepting chemotaxis protein [Pseudomonas aeruginosa]RQJ00855.1 methyl-accepting chemotaxis protein [Pseudomonas aeruginosa]HEJ3624768.1 methyl-accepting chemotaxis protein [Pseudomonas aeruginosa]